MIEISGTFDPKSKEHTVCGYVRVSNERVANTVEIKPGLVNADYDANGNLVGIELLGPVQIKIIREVAGPEIAEAIEGMLPPPLIAA